MSANTGLGVFVLALSGVCGIFAWWRLNADKRNAELSANSMNWSTTQGQITDVRIDQQRTQFFNNNTDTTSETVRYQPKVEYLFNVGGQQYQGTRINFTIMDFSFENRAKKAIENYKTGTTVAVFYDPADPRQSVLDRDTRPRTVNISTIVLFTATAVVALVGIGLFFIPM